MKPMICCIALALLCGCASKPPKPAGCKGEFRPVNQAQQAAPVVLSAAESVAMCQGARNGQS